MNKHKYDSGQFSVTCFDHLGRPILTLLADHFLEGQEIGEDGMDNGASSYVVNRCVYNSAMPPKKGWQR